MYSDFRSWTKKLMSSQTGSPSSESIVYRDAMVQYVSERGSRHLKLIVPINKFQPFDVETENLANSLDFIVFEYSKYDFVGFLFGNIATSEIRPRKIVSVRKKSKWILSVYLDDDRDARRARRAISKIGERSALRWTRSETKGLTIAIRSMEVHRRLDTPRRPIPELSKTKQGAGKVFDIKAVQVVPGGRWGRLVPNKKISSSAELVPKTRFQKTATSVIPPRPAPPRKPKPTPPPPRPAPLPEE